MGLGAKNYSPPPKKKIFFEIVKNMGRAKFSSVFTENFNKKSCLLVELQSFCEMLWIFFQTLYARICTLLLLYETISFVFLY